MEKRAILAIILTFLVIMLWGVIQSKFFPPPPSKPPTQEVKKEQVAPEEKGAEKGIKLRETKSPKEKPIPGTKIVAKKEVPVETQYYWAVFTNEDARLEHFKLKKYEDTVEESPFTIRLTRFVQNLFDKKEDEPKRPAPLDLVNTSEKEGLPLGLTIFGSPSEGNWEVDKDGLRLLSTGEKDEITFVKTLENGLRVLKRYRFSSSYSHSQERSLKNLCLQDLSSPPCYF